MEQALNSVAVTDSGDDDLEFTLLNKREVMVYQIPPAASAAGHKAEDWKQCIWRGKMRVCGKRKDLYIKLLDASSESLFAQCIVLQGDHEKFVERVVDSSRYFVLKITNANKHAFIGLGFEERNDAFDFNCCLADFKSRFVERDEEESHAPQIQAPPKDLSLKEGQTIKITIAGLEGKKKRETAEAAPASGGLGAFGLAPPPSSGSRQSRRSAAQEANAMFGAGGSSAFPAPPPAAPKQDDFGGFGGDFADFQSAGAQASGDPFAPAPAAPQPATAAADPFATAPAAPQSRTATADPFAGVDFGSQWTRAENSVPAPAGTTAPGASVTALADPFASAPAAPKDGKAALLDDFDIFK